MKLSICILSWLSHRTLRSTLDSYEKNGLLRFADEKLIFFQEMSHTDIRIAERYGLDYFGSEQNLGIGEGFQRLAEKATGDLVLYLQNDFVLVENLDQDSSELTAAMQMLQDKEIDVALFRHRQHPGVPNWAEDNVKGNEARWQSHLFNSIYWMESPELAYPEKIHRSNIDPRFLVTSSRYMNYTDNPSLYRRDWLLDNLGDKFTANSPHSITWPEVVIQPWWEKQDFRIAQATGLFTHVRHDRHTFSRRIVRKLANALKRLGLYGFISRIPFVKQYAKAWTR